MPSTPNKSKASRGRVYAWTVGFSTSPADSSIESGHKGKCERAEFNELVAHILLGVLSYFAQLEASKISRRTKAGLERVRAQGKTLGRPDGFTTHSPILARMKAEGYSQGKMSRETGLAINTVKGYLERLEGQQDAGSALNHAQP